LSADEPAFFFKTQVEKVDRTILQIKEASVKILQKLLIFTDWYQSPENRPHIDYYTLIQPVLELLITGLTELGRSEEIRDLMDDVSLCNLVTKTLQFLHRFAKKPNFYKLFSDNKYVIIYDICFSFMRTFGAELIEMEDNPSQFVRISLDMADKQ